MRVEHTIEPVFDNNSRLLILGSFPSVRSREAGFYYAHPRNRFWHLLAELYDAPLPSTTEEKKSFLLRNGLALWDVIRSCEIKGSSDSSITEVVPNDLSVILKSCRITNIITNGNTAFKLYMRYQLEKTGIVPLKLPSTSPANASWSFDRLLGEWGNIKTLEI